MTFKDHFSERPGAYARYRPLYPKKLFSTLASLAPARETAWDCATGNGQAATAPAAWFGTVVATDASVAQIREAMPNPRVRYHVARAENSGLADDSIDLVTVAQALHWFDLEAFYHEARRVLRRDGVLAVWSYSIMRISPELDELIDRLYHETLATDWPPERRHIDEDYRTLPFPLADLEIPPLEMEARLSLDDVVGYLGTWSAVQHHIAREGTDPLRPLAPALARAWGSPGETKPVRWPLAIRAGRFD
jgi:SAM-dependent methyltransferase